MGGCEVPIFPLQIGDAFQHLKGGVKLILQRIQWTDFQGDFDDAFAKFEPALKRKMAQAAGRLGGSQHLRQGMKSGDMSELMRSDSNVEDTQRQANAPAACAYC